jgi:hypothetical protein
VPPLTGSFEGPVTRKTIHFWTKPIAQLLEASMSPYTKGKKMATDEGALSNMKIMDVVLGDNHDGQGKIQLVIKIVLQNNTQGSR